MQFIDELTDTRVHVFLENAQDNSIKISPLNVKANTRYRFQSETTLLNVGDYVITRNNKNKEKLSLFCVLQVSVKGKFVSSGTLADCLNPETMVSLNDRLIHCLESLLKDTKFLETSGLKDVVENSSDYWTKGFYT